MSLTSRNDERAKFASLLKLAHAQIQALESDDMLAFDQILAAKRGLIESLNDARGLLADDPALRSVAARIEDADRMAQRLLYRIVGRIMREMNDLNRQTKARGAYQAADPLPAHRPAGFFPDASSYMDVKS